MSNEMRYVQKQGITIQQLGDELILYDTQNKTTHVLNPTARLIWELCDGKQTMKDMERTVRAHFSVSIGHDLARDIQQTVKGLREKGLLGEI